MPSRLPTLPCAIGGLILIALPAAARADVSASRAPMIASTATSDEIEILRLEDRREPAETLYRFLASERPETRARACLAIGRSLGPVAPNTPPHSAVAMLAARLREDAHASVRGAAAFALGLLQTDAAAAALAGHLASGRETHAEVRALAVEGLGRCGPDAHPLAMARALEDDDVRVVQAALLAVWKGRRTDHLQRVITLSAHLDPEVRWCAAYALMRMLGAPPSGRTAVPTGGPLSPREATSIHLRLITLARDSDLRVRLQALRGLGRVPSTSPFHAEAVTIAREAMQEPDPRARVEAVRSLGALFAGSDQAEVLTRALADPNIDVRVTAIEALRQVCALPRLTERLAPYLEIASARGAVQREAASASTRESASAWERATAATALMQSAAESGAYEAGLSLVHKPAADPEWSVRYAAAEGLAALVAQAAADSTLSPAQLEALDQAAAPLLAQFLADDPRVAKGALGAWLALRPHTPDAFASLLRDADRYLSNEDEILRTLSLQALDEYLAAAGPDELNATDLEALYARADRGLDDDSIDARLAGVTLLGHLAGRGDAARPEAQSAAHPVERPQMRPAARLACLAHEDHARTVRQAACDALRGLAAEVLAALNEHRASCQPPLALDPGPEETGRTRTDYARALQLARRAEALVIETAGGVIEAEIFSEDAPLTIVNFIELAERGYFDGGTWHRVVPDFVAQDGCPRGDGWGGPGHTIRCEINSRHYETGVLGMALSGKDTGGSQFFFTLSDQPHLDGRYTIFGRVTRGLDLLIGPEGAIRQGETRLDRVRVRLRS
jgi:cyclophilin family peptidyl-prolyl cis-trans isomerase/HEAT repeat protein